MAKVRIQVRLDERQCALAKREAQALGISFAAYVRRAIQQTLSAQDDPPWMRYAGLVQSGDPHSTRSVDEVVYGNRP